RTPHPFFQQPNALRAVHAGLEELIDRSGVGWTFLRPGAFALNCRNWWAPQIQAGDVVRWFHGAAATAPIHEHDIAAVAVRALCEDGHDRKEYVLTGPESVTQRDQVQIIGTAIGRALRFEELLPEAARQQLSAWPAAVVEMLLSAYAAAVGIPALVTSTVADVTGAPAPRFRASAPHHPLRPARQPRPGAANRCRPPFPPPRRGRLRIAAVTLTPPPRQGLSTRSAEESADAEVGPPPAIEAPRAGEQYRTDNRVHHDAHR